jgi:C-terminal processing protease CtpA/Prc
VAQASRLWATLRCRHFDAGTEEEIDRAFAELARLGPRGLILDLRDNPGGTFAAGRVGAHLMNRTVDGGTFFAAPARPQVLAGQTADLPRISRLASVEEFNRLLRKHGAFVLQIEPVRPYYAGPVVVLVNRRSASAVEPLAAVLQEQRRATIIGERTAGAMLSLEVFELTGG